MPLDRLVAALTPAQTQTAAQYVRAGEQKVGEIPGLAPDIAARPICSVGIVGGGLMGTGIAIATLNAGIPVTLVELRQEVLGKAGERIRSTIQRDVEKGRITADTAAERIAALTLSTDLAAFAEMDLVIEAVFEDMAVKEQVFTALDAITRPDAILASNTSTLDLDAIAGFVADPSRVVGLHFFSPANIMRLLEVVRGERTDPTVLATAMTFAKRIHKVGVIAGVCDGFIGNRMFEEYLRQVYWLLEEGARPQQIDAALEAWGMAMGPVRVLDLAGHDIGYAIRQRRIKEQPDRPYSTVLDELIARKRLGQKTGAGVYLYPDGRTAVPDPEIEAMIVAHSEKLGIERREISDAEIVERCVLALVNEGAKIVEEGIAYRPVDVDVIYLNGYGFPRERGGPMFVADTAGLPAVLAAITARATGRNGWAWEPAPLLSELANRGGTFADLNDLA